MDLDESSSKMKLKLLVTVEWTDSRVKFLHLKADENRNILTPREMDTLWIPALIFPNTRQNLELDFRAGYGFVSIKNGKIGK